MSSYLAGLSILEKIYLACAVFGGGFFILRTILMLAGVGDAHSDAGIGDMDAHADIGDMSAHGDIGDMDAHADVGHMDSDTDAGDADHGDHHLEDIDHATHGDVDAGLRLLTLQGLTAFIMMFGLTGFAISRSSVIGSIFTIAIGILVGLFAMWLVAKGFQLMRSLQSSGTMQIYDAIGEEGTVYLTIPAEGIGKIQINVSGRLMVMDAVSQDKVEVKTGERARVSEISTDGMLMVRKL